MERGVHSQCAFLHCPADRLDGIPDASVDVVTTRAVLAYVADKRAALAEFHRVLKPGGRIALAEPMLQDDAFLAMALKMRLATENIRTKDRFLPLLHRWKAAQYPDSQEGMSSNPLVNFSERNLFEFIRLTGFIDIHLELHIDMLPSIIRSWDVFLNTSPHPWAPAPGTILAEQFTPAERELFESVMRPTVEAPDAVTISRNICKRDQATAWLVTTTWFERTRVRPADLSAGRSPGERYCGVPVISSWSVSIQVQHAANATQCLAVASPICEHGPQLACSSGAVCEVL